jgi:hypothetical protein
MVRGGKKMNGICYSVSYNTKKRVFSVYRDGKKIGTFPTEKAAWDYVAERQGDKS